MYFEIVKRLEAYDLLSLNELWKTERMKKMFNLTLLFILCIELKINFHELG